MDALSFIIAAIITAGILFVAHKKQREREDEAARKADLMMKAARAKTDAREANEGEFWYRDIDISVILKGPRVSVRSRNGVILHANMKSEHLDEWVLLSLGYTKIGDL